MNTESTPEHPPTPEAANPPPPAKRRHIPHLWGWVFAVLAVVVLAGLTLPIFSQTCEKATQTKALASAKQIALSLKLYAGDHDGNFPTAEGNPAGEPAAGSKARDANSAFRNLFPTYCSAEKLFYVPHSAYCGPTAPDEILDKAANCLRAGENAYAYIAGLKDADSTSLPLVVDGTDGTRHYVTNAKKRGGVWGGKQAIVIHVDTSGEVTNLAGPARARFIPRSKDEPTQNLLDAAFLATHRAHLLDPAVAEPHR